MKNTDLIIYMLEDIREITLKGVNGLTKEQLFAEPLPGEFPIGAYLMHLAECELWWLHVMDGLPMDAELTKRAYSNTWFDAGDDFNPPKEAIEIDEYFDVMAKCRAKLIEFIRSITDEEIEKKVYLRWTQNGEEKSKEFTVKWILYHLIEHEAHTRGQMFLLIRMAGFKKKGENN
jgi:uncharacterized damage-inducible protein DinB